jgi:tetratricopeptide (TPR) repeat protein
MQYPNLRRDAEQSFLKQAEMEPWNADPYYFLGELYQLEGLVIRAEKQFEKALEINLEHTKAGIRMNQINPARMRAAQSQKRKKG